MLQSQISTARPVHDGAGAGSVRWVIRSQTVNVGLIEAVTKWLYGAMGGVGGGGGEDDSVGLASGVVRAIERDSHAMLSWVPDFCPYCLILCVCVSE